MADPHDDHSDDTPLNERVLDLLVFVPAGIAVSVIEELPKLAARGRDRLGVRVSSARAVGQFAMKAGRDEFCRRSVGLVHTRADRPTPEARSPRTARPEGVAPSGVDTTPVATPRHPSVRIPSAAGNGHMPAVSTLSIPGFDTLSASQVVQRLDGLNRVELVSVRAYEASTRGRRTILSRVDQLLDERS
jgi:hypothetical protein